MASLVPAAPMSEHQDGGGVARKRDRRGREPRRHDVSNKRRLVDGQLFDGARPAEYTLDIAFGEMVRPSARVERAIEANSDLLSGCCERQSDDSVLQSRRIVRAFSKSADDGATLRFGPFHVNK